MSAGELTAENASHCINSLNAMIISFVSKCQQVNSLQKMPVTASNLLMQ